MTVSRLKSELSINEYMGWIEYFKTKDKGEEKKDTFSMFDSLATDYKGA